MVLDPNIMPAVVGNPGQRVRAMLTSDETFATTLLVWCADEFHDHRDAHGDLEFLSWHPATLRKELEERYGCKLPQTTVDRLMAAIAVTTSDTFFQNVPDFIQLANVLSGDTFDPTVFDPADSAECAWAVTEALLLHPPENDEPFSDDIRAYIGYVLKDEGYVTPPDILKIAIDGDFSDRVSYDFADDPEMFEGIYAVQQGKTEEIEEIVRSGLQELVSQLRELPLRHGDTRALEQQATQFVRA